MVAVSELVILDGHMHSNMMNGLREATSLWGHFVKMLQRTPPFVNVFSNLVRFIKGTIVNFYHNTLLVTFKEITKRKSQQWKSCYEHCCDSEKLHDPF